MTDKLWKMLVTIFLDLASQEAKSEAQRENDEGDPEDH